MAMVLFEAAEAMAPEIEEGIVSVGRWAGYGRKMARSGAAGAAFAGASSGVSKALNYLSAPANQQKISTAAKHAKTLHKYLTNTGGTSNVGRGGFGAVGIASNNVTRRNTSRKPKFVQSTGGIKIQHKEFITEIAGSTTYSTTKLELAPTVTATYPWLHKLAHNFGKYKFSKLSVHYTNISASTERGRVGVTYSNDPTDAAPGSKVEASMYTSSTENSVWHPFNVGITQVGGWHETEVGADLRHATPGVVYISTSNCADTSIVGEVYISYEIEFKDPVAHGTSTWVGAVNDSVLTTAGYLFAVGELSVYGSNEFSQSPDTDGTIICNKIGTYRYAIKFTGTGLPTITRPLDTTGSTVLFPSGDDTVYTGVTNLIGNSGNASAMGEFKVTVPGQLFVISDTAATTRNGFKIWIDTYSNMSAVSSY